MKRFFSECLRNSLYLLCKDLNADSFVSCADTRFTSSFIRLLFYISRSSAVIENDPCIRYLMHITNGIEPIIDLILECSHSEEVLTIFFEAIIRLKS